MPRGRSGLSFLFQLPEDAVKIGYEIGRNLRLAGAPKSQENRNWGAGGEPGLRALTSSSGGEDFVQAIEACQNRGDIDTGPLHAWVKTKPVDKTRLGTHWIIPIMLR